MRCEFTLVGDNYFLKSIDIFIIIWYNVTNAKG